MVCEKNQKKPASRVCVYYRKFFCIKHVNLCNLYGFTGLPPLLSKSTFFFILYFRLK